MSLLKGGNELFANLDEKLASSTRNVILQEIRFIESTDADNESKKIYSKYKPLNASYNLHLNTKEHKEGKQVQKQPANEKENAYLTPKVILYPADKIEMNWKEPRRIGPGFANLGNTCFLNSVLQVLTYTAPLVNFANSDAHRNSCAAVGFCMLCEFRNHLIRVAKHCPQNGPIRPMTIIQRLSCISKNFKFGRQEDAHEFLRYVIEAFRKSCLAGKKNLDRFSKETTAINQIFGGFYRSQVTCLSCKISSNTFDPMMELNLDIKESKSIVQAMKRTVQTEKLDGENKYSCERCKKKAAALKRGNIHAPPKILTLQLKRFDFQRLFGGKISKDVAFDEILDISPFLSNKPESPVLYKLYAVLVHSGFSCNSGHYYCYVKAANGIWYEMNDSRVSQVGLQTVLRAQAYLLFYSLIGSKKSKASLKVTHNNTKQFNTSSSSTESKPSISAVKDIDLQLFKKSPRIVPLIERDKVKFSLSGTLRQKPTDSVKESAGSISTSQTVPVKSGGISQLSRESSLEAIRKEYDSSESEETLLSTKKTSQINEKASNDSGSNKNIEIEAKSDDITSKPLPVSTPLSPSKGISIENLHKKKAKTPNGAVHSKSKFGRWMPVRSLSCNFTPRSVLHRSLSDNSSEEKAKSASNKRDTKRQLSVQIDSKSQSEKIDRTKLWNVEENKRLDPPFGPMTSFVRPSDPDADHSRERTSSVTSETGSVSTKTGDWDVHEKDLLDTPAAPYVQERHFAGWSVENHSEKKSSDRENGKILNEKPQTAIPRKLFGNRADKSHRSEKQNDKVSSGFDLCTSGKDRKTSRKRSSNEEAVLTDESDLDTFAKRSKKEELKSSESHRTRKKSKKGKKKKKSKKSKGYDEDKNVDEEKDTKERPARRDTMKAEDIIGKKYRQEYDNSGELKNAENSLKGSLETTKKMNDRGNEKVRKRHKKSKKSSKLARSNDLSGCAVGREKQRIRSADEDDSRYSNVKPPRRIELNKLETIAPQPDGAQKVSNSTISIPLKGQSSRKEVSGLDNDEKLTTPLKKSKYDIPEKQWDEKPKTATSWNGSSDNAVLESLLSKKSKVTTWDDEASQNICYSVSGGSKRNRDRWDDEYDQGKVKKTKNRHSHSSSKYKDNPFQKLQNRRNYESNKR